MRHRLCSYRGWVAAPYVQVVYQGAPVVLTPAVAPVVGVTVVTYSRVYWDTHYTAYPWYRNWGVYARYPAGRVTSYNRSVDCADGSCTAKRSTTGVYGGTADHTRTCAGGECSATRKVVGPSGNSASRLRTCSADDYTCTVTRTGPRGGTGTGTRVFRP